MNILIESDPRMCSMQEHEKIAILLIMGVIFLVDGNNLLIKHNDNY